MLDYKITQYEMANPLDYSQEERITEVRQQFEECFQFVYESLKQKTDA